MASQRFRTFKICPKDVAFVWRQSRAVTLIDQQRGHVMNDIRKAQEGRQGWTRPSDIAWTASYLIATILLVLLWANVPA
jgi:hypothetical protein